MIRFFILITALVALPFAIAPGVLAQSVSGEPATAGVEVTVWRRISDPTLLYVSTRPEGGTWRTVNTALDMSMESRSGRFHQSNAVLVEVPLGGALSANVEVTVWRRISNPDLLYVSTRPEGGSWRTVNTALDMSMESRSGRFHQSNAVLVEVPLPTTTFTGAFGAIEYTVALEDGWSLTVESPDGHNYRRDDPTTNLSTYLYVRPFGPVELTLAEYAESVRDGLESEIAVEWPSYSLFEFTSLEEVSAAGQGSFELRYIRQQSSEYCTVSVVERVVGTETADGLTAGVRAIVWVCEEEDLAYDPLRQALLDSLQVGARAAE